MAFARGVVEYGSVIFIAGNMPFKSEIAPLLIVIELEQYDYGGATAIATVTLAASFSALLFINLVQAWNRRHQRSEEHTSELQSLMRISYAVFCLKKKKKKKQKYNSKVTRSTKNQRSNTRMITNTNARDEAHTQH